MFTLIASGTGVAFLSGLVAVCFPALFPPRFRAADGSVPVYFEAAAVIVTLVLVGQVPELRARRRTGEAIRQLLDLSPANGPRRRSGRQRAGAAARSRAARGPLARATG